jgi:hypothetical protein
MPDGAQTRESQAAAYGQGILERLIPSLYCAARARGQPMTALVNDAIETFLADLVASQAPQLSAEDCAANGGEKGGHQQQPR